LHFLQKPLRWLQAISKYKGTTSGGPNFAFDLCAKKVTPQILENLNLKSWRLAFCGAEPIRKETVERFIQTFSSAGFVPESFFPCYGLAEGTLIVSGATQGELPQFELVSKEALRQKKVKFYPPNAFQTPDTLSVMSCGKSMMGQDIQIVNSENLNILGPGEVGEVFVSGPSVALGYWRQEERSAQVFRLNLEGNEKTYLRTGDLGFIKNGELFISGRQKDVLIIRGLNYYPQDLERSVEKVCPELRMGCGAAFSIEENEEEHLVMVYELEKEFLAGYSEELKQSLAKRMIEVLSKEHEIELFAFVLVEHGEVPKTSSGKIAHYACKEAYLNKEMKELGHWSRHEEFQKLKQVPLVPELVLSKSAQEIRDFLKSEIADRLELSIDLIDSSQPMTSYGLDSKDAISLSGDLEDFLGKKLSPTLLWKYPSIDALAAYLEKM